MTGKRTKYTVAIALFALAFVPAAEEYYRNQIFVPAIKADFAATVALKDYLAKFKAADENLEFYFASGVLASFCSTTETGCFDWKKFPNVKSIVTEAVGVSVSPAVLLLRECPHNVDCIYLDGWGSFAKPLDADEFSAVLSTTTTERNCRDAVLDAVGRKLPITYRSEYCTSINYSSGKISSVQFYARVAQPYYARLLTDIWFRSELNVVLEFGRLAYKIDQVWSNAEIFGDE